MNFSYNRENSSSTFYYNGGQLSTILGASTTSKGQVKSSEQLAEDGITLPTIWRSEITTEAYFPTAQYTLGTRGLGNNNAPHYRHNEYRFAENPLRDADQNPQPISTNGIITDWFYHSVSEFGDNYDTIYMPTIGALVYILANDKMTLVTNDGKTRFSLSTISNSTYNYPLLISLNSDGQPQRSGVGVGAASSVETSIEFWSDQGFGVMNRLILMLAPPRGFAFFF